MMIKRIALLAAISAFSISSALAGDMGRVSHVGADKGRVSRIADMGRMSQIGTDMGRVSVVAEARVSTDGNFA